jgi:hypothetical protein
MTPAQAQSLTEAITNNADVNLIFAPRVTTLCGHQAHVAAEDTVPMGGGTTNIGLSFDVLPECSTNSGMIDLQVLFQGTRLTAQSTIEEMRTNTTLTVPDGNTFVLTMNIPGNGPWFAGDPTNFDSGRALVMLLTATMIDPAGNPLYAANTNSPPQTITANPSGIFPGPASPSNP